MTCLPCPLPAAAAARLGGRIHTHVLADGDVRRTVDLGATFVCGACVWYRAGSWLGPGSCGVRGLAVVGRGHPPPAPQPACRRTRPTQAGAFRRHPTHAGTSRDPPVNPIFEYAVDVLGLQLRAKKRDGPGATALYDR